MKRKQSTLRMSKWAQTLSWLDRTKRKRRPKDQGGSEAVTVEPDRPKQGEGGAAAALEFDE